MKVYVDDLIVHTNRDCFDDHLKHLELMFKACEANDILLKPKKCYFGFREIVYLGHIINALGIKPDPDKANVILNLPIPANLSDLRSFLGMVNYYRRFIPKLAAIASPLFDLLKKDVKFHFDEAELCAFNAIKEFFVEELILLYPDWNKEFWLTTDACSHGIGGVLSQFVEELGYDRPVCFYSKSLNDSQRHYSSFDLEFLGIVKCLDYFKYYLVNNKFTLFTDHKNLAGLKSTLRLSGRRRHMHLRWLDILMSYDFIIKHKSGKSISHADYMSRCPHCVDLDPVVHGISEARLNNFNLADLVGFSDIIGNYDWKTEQENDPVCQKLKKKNYINMNEGILYKGDRIIVPANLQVKLLEFAHSNSVSGGHVSVQKTVSKLRKRFYWPKMHDTVVEYKLHCHKCQIYDKDNRRISTMRNFFVTKTFELIGIDIVGPMKLLSSVGYLYCLTITDYFTRYSIAVPIKDMETKTVANALLDKWVFQFGTPKTIITDQGSNFCSKLFDALCKTIQIKRIVTEPYSQATNGRVERLNQTLFTMLAKCGKNYARWDKMITAICFCYNNTPHSVTGFSPHSLIFGRDANFPIDWKLPSIDTRIPQSAKEFLEQLINDLDYIRSMAIANNKNYILKRYKKLGGYPEFNVGDLVLFKLKQKYGNEDNIKKFSPKWCPIPYQVIEKFNDYYQLAPATGGLPLKNLFHGRNLKKYFVSSDDKNVVWNEPEDAPILLEEEDSTLDINEIIMEPYLIPDVENEEIPNFTTEDTGDTNKDYGLTIPGVPLTIEPPEGYFVPEVYVLNTNKIVESSPLDVSIYWDGENAWFDGKLYMNSSGNFAVEYVDSEIHEEDLDKLCKNHFLAFKNRDVAENYALHSELRDYKSLHLGFIPKKWRKKVLKPITNIDGINLPTTWFVETIKKKSGRGYT
eukprot:TRINITY_DN1522_c0_g1_i1.p1 TRINITY_DN1522_c0_g1~~TRINITY_DN1522_c0_g1_i1.p1  ORF type:complete len:915 (-),score=197.95 TRINITY_DN1522_c0_g1_i1:170-2914(-)